MECAYGPADAAMLAWAGRGYKVISHSDRMIQKQANPQSPIVGALILLQAYGFGSRVAHLLPQHALPTLLLGAPLGVPLDLRSHSLGWST